MNPFDERLDKVFSQRWKRLNKSPNSDAWWSELESLAEVDLQEWNRIYEHNQILRRELLHLQKRYTLPKNTLDEFLTWVEEDLTRYARFRDEFFALMDIHKVPQQFRDSIWQKTTWPFPGGPFRTLGFPSYETHLVDGELRTQIIIDQRTKINNPIVQEIILRHRVRKEPPPEPVPIPGHPRKKKDPRPLQEWHKRFSELSKTEIGLLLGVSRTKVQEWLPPESSPIYKS